MSFQATSTPTDCVQKPCASPGACSYRLRTLSERTIMKAVHLVFSFVSPSMSQVNSVALPLVIGTAVAVSNFGAKGAEAGAGKEEELLKLLNSNALPQDKAIACKELAVYGTEKAVPVLA